MKTDFIPMGFQYYRAPTPARSEWRKDLENIKKWGYNTVKYWIQWRWNEPREGEYDFSDIDELMDLASEYGLKVVLNTILEVTPVWFDKKYPESAMISNRGEKVKGFASPYRQIGGMPGPCFHHEKANELKAKFLAECVKRYANHPALYIWDLWNEPELTEGIYREPQIENLLCYCDESVKAFSKWLEKKYVTIEKLNEVWGRPYLSFDDVEPPKNFGTTADMIDWRLFFCDTITDEFAKRVAVVKKYDTKHQAMCHTVPIPLFNSITCCSDDFSIAKHGDLIGNSVGSNPMAADLLKSVAEGKNIINAEIHACYGNALNGFHMPDVNDMIKHIFIPLVHGSKGFLFWQFRPEILGDEAPAWGNTTLDGKDTDWNRIAMQMHDVLKEYYDEICEFQPAKGEIAVYCDKANEIYSWEGSYDTKLFVNSLIGAYNLFYRNNYAVDFIDSNCILNGKLDGYKAVYFPATFLFDDYKVEKVKEYVSNGGTVIIEALFGCINQDSGRHSLNIPGCGMGEILGKRIDKFFSSTMIENAYDWKVFTSEDGERVLMKDGESILCGAKYLLTYTGNQGKQLASFSQDRTAVSEYTIGKGRIIDIATLFAYGYSISEESENLKWIRKVVGQPNSKYSNLPIGVRVDEVYSNGKGFLVIDNTTKSEVSITLPCSIVEVVGNGVLSGNALTVEKNKTVLVKIK
ncbi:MAG: beta-galactosidase [Clostridia bacterium]|nr:beta-galactosidase [Clostridia bacterium]